MLTRNIHWLRSSETSANVTCWRRKIEFLRSTSWLFSRTGRTFYRKQNHSWKERWQRTGVQGKILPDTTYFLFRLHWWLHCRSWSHQWGGKVSGICTWQITVKAVCIFFAFAPPTFTSLTDFHTLRGGRVVLVVRDQKTSKSHGTVRVPLPEDLSRAYLKWITEVRPLAVDESSVQHSAVFLKEHTGKQFDSSGFSSYVKKKFVHITGYKLGLQMMRRLFATSMCCLGVLTYTVFVDSIHQL